MPSSPHPLRNGGVDTPPSPLPTRIQVPFRSTVSVQKLRRFNTLILVFRLGAFSFSFAAAVFMFTNSPRSTSLTWSDFDAFRFVFAANTIVAVYSMVEMGASIWEIYAGATVFPELIQVWFDFGHDQVFGYLLLAAEAAGTELARTMREKGTCTESGAFCVQAGIAIGLGFAGFLLVGLSSLLSAFRLACFTFNGSRFHL